MKKVYNMKHMIVGCVCVAILLSFSVLVASSIFATSAGLPVIKRPQEKSNWCWVATGQMIGRYKNSSSTITQTYLVTYIKGNGTSAPNVGGTNNDIKEAIRISSGNTVTATTSSTLIYSSHKSLINASKPVAARFEWSSGGAHAVVVIGYSDTATTDPKLTLLDPIAGNATTSYKYLDLITGKQIQAGYGLYTHSIKLN